MQRSPVDLVAFMQPGYKGLPNAEVCAKTPWTGEKGVVTNFCLGRSRPVVCHANLLPTPLKNAKGTMRQRIRDSVTITREAVTLPPSLTQNKDGQEAWTQPSILRDADKRRTFSH
eukprot:68504-Prorocentrum_minimum.AAC.3